MRIVEFLNARYDEAEAAIEFASSAGVAAEPFPAGRLRRDIAMKRDLLTLHKPRKADFYDNVEQCDYCASQCHSHSGLMCEEPDGKYPCDTVRTLATEHADHPDYQKAWKLEDAPEVTPRADDSVPVLLSEGWWKVDGATAECFGQLLDRMHEEHRDRH